MRDAGPPERPLVSFIVASYNYGRFIGRTLGSILNQTEQNLEVVVVDDASSDDSLDVIRSFGDPRIRLYTNETNLGLVRTYNRGLSLANGEYVTYVDSDDWIDPRKIEEQLAYFRENPGVDIVGTYVKFVDNDGNPHPRSATVEAFYNQPCDFNTLDTWVGPTRLFACSALMPTSVHQKIGPRDTTMAIASDLEFWTRAHVLGFRFGIVERPLLMYRLHDDSVSRRDPLTAFLEISYVFYKNILPAIDEKSAPRLIPAILDFLLNSGDFESLDDRQRHQLLGLVLGLRKIPDCDTFKRACLTGTDPELISLGRRFHASFFLTPTHPLQARITDLHDDITRRAAEIDRLTAAVAVRDKAIEGRDHEIALRDKSTEMLGREIAARDGAITLNGAEIEARDVAIAKYEKDIITRDQEIAARGATIAIGNERIEARDGEVAALTNAVAALDADIASRKREIAAREHEIAIRDEAIAIRNGEIARRDGAIAIRDRMLASRSTMARQLVRNILRRWRARA